MNRFMRFIYWKLYLPSKLWTKRWFPASDIAYLLLHKLKGIEIGAGAQVDFKLNRHSPFRVDYGRCS
jgi:hypothetical protein